MTNELLKWPNIYSCLLEIRFSFCLSFSQINGWKIIRTSVRRFTNNLNLDFTRIELLVEGTYQCWSVDSIEFTSLNTWRDAFRSIFGLHNSYTMQYRLLRRWVHLHCMWPKRRWNPKWLTQSLIIWYFRYVIHIARLLSQPNLHVKWFLIES